MNRRYFLKNTTLAGISVSAISIAAACNEPAKQTEPGKKTEAAFNLEEATIGSLQQQMQAGKLSSKEITQMYLDRIRDLDKAGPKLNSVIELNPDALSQATAMDEERKNGKTRGPLHGIPIMIKDNIDTADKMKTTAGSLALADNIAKKDAFIISKLRLAGVVILGKTNLSEWANFRSTKSCSGWSSRGGQTKNPYILTYNPCGSSSGSAVAVAANLCAVAVGTETDGSVTCPASVNGIVGIKPTVGLLSRSGIIPISHTQDTAGPMARTVKDAAILLGQMTGIDPDDVVTRESEGKFYSDYTQFLQADSLKGKRIGINKKAPGDNHLVIALFNQVKDVLQKQGATLVEFELPKKWDDLVNQEFELLKFEFKDGVNKYLANSNSAIKSLEAVIEFNKKNEERAMPFFKQNTLEDSQKTDNLHSSKYLTAYKECHEGSRKILDEIFSTHKLDAICGITMGPSCAIDPINGDRWGDVYAPLGPAVAGYPHISVPCGLAYELPVGLSFFSQAYTEPSLLGIAYAYEQATEKRTVPKYKEFLGV